jgi:hypothetical protein
MFIRRPDFEGEPAMRQMLLRHSSDLDLLIAMFPDVSTVRGLRAGMLFPESGAREH